MTVEITNFILSTGDKSGSNEGKINLGIKEK